MSRKKVRFEFNPLKELDIELPEDADRDEVLDAAAEYLKDQILNACSKQRSPVDGTKFPKLSKDYKAFKKAAGHPGIPNLEFSSDMLSAVDVYRKGNRIVAEVTGDQSDKADGHCNHSGDSSLPLRRFIPLKGEDDGFSEKIMNGIERIIRRGG